REPNHSFNIIFVLVRRLKYNMIKPINVTDFTNYDDVTIFISRDHRSTFYDKGRKNKLTTYKGKYDSKKDCYKPRKKFSFRFGCFIHSFPLLSHIVLIVNFTIVR